MNKIKRFLVIMSAALGVCGISLILGIPSEDSLMSRAVKLRSDGHSCSGEQVRAPSGVDYILTAGHCRILEQEGSIEAVTEGGKSLMRRVIAEDPESDLLLLEGLPNLRGLEIADSSSRFQHLRTFTHGRGMDTYKTEGEVIQDVETRIGPLFEIMSAEEEAKCRLPKHEIIDGFFGKLCVLHAKFTVHTAMTVPGSSGGMIVDDAGRLVGVVSGGDGVFSLMVRTRDINKFLAGY